MSRLFAAAAPSLLALETDQFTVPQVPLQDIGPQLSRKIVAVIEADRSGRDPHEVLSNWVGNNVFESRLTRWVHRTRPADDDENPAQPVSFRPDPFHSVYRLTFSPAPASFLVDAPTVNVHGYYMGTDKIDHFFQQGHEYFEVVRKREADGATQIAAITAAVNHGVSLEHGYFGTLTTGVYSNGDLAANYAGMKFYLNLQHPVRIGNRIWPPMFERTMHGWRLREGIDPGRLLEPFVSNHLDESLNPSRYRFSRRAIRSAVQKRCESWMSFYEDRLDLVAPSGQSFASTWFGEDYGHWLPAGGEISIATECTFKVTAGKSRLVPPGTRIP